VARDTVLERLFQIAEGQDGYFTTRQAAELGVSRVAIKQAEQRGRLERATRGVYRLTRYPYTANVGQLWEAVLWPQSRKEITAVLSHDTALVLHNLSDINPPKTHITLPKRFRIQREKPEWLEVHRDHLLADDTELVNGLPVTTITRTLIDIGKTNRPAVLADAIRDAKRLGVLVPEALEAGAGKSTRQ